MDTAPPLSDELVNEVRERYGVGPHYAHAYLDYWCQARGQRYDRLAAILAEPAPAPMWFDYAMSANWRGAQLSQLLEPHIAALPEPIAGPRRYLDIGCGVGGLLVEFAKLGLEVHGIEIDRQRIVLAEANCRDHDLHNHVSEASILDVGLHDRLGTFDLITMIDVIEHVLDVPLALANAVALLRPNGLLFLEIPNKHSLNFVAHDGHFDLFGITLLDRSDAILYHQEFFHFTYDVGDYFLLPYYRHHLERLQCRTALLAAPLRPVPSRRRRVQLVTELLRSYVRYRRKTWPNLTPDLNHAVQRHFFGYLGGMGQDLAQLALTTRTRKEFIDKYFADFWLIGAYKKSV